MMVGECLERGGKERADGFLLPVFNVLMEEHDWKCREGYVN